MANDFNKKLNGILGYGRDVVGGIESVSNLLGINTRPQETSDTTTGFNVNNFKTNVLDKGVMRTNLFFMKITPPEKLNSWGDKFTKDLHFVCDQVNIPGVQFNTSPYRPFGYGPVEVRPHSPQFASIDASFLISSDAQTYRYFNEWMNVITNYNMSPNTNDFRNEQYDIAYKDEYMTEIKIISYNDFSKEILVHKLVEAFPINMSPIQLNWGSTDELARMQVSFSYTDWYIDNFNLQSGTGVSRQEEDTGLTGLQKIQKGITVLQTVASMSRPRNIQDVINVVNNGNIIKEGILDIF